jgi:hypothetical protein
MLKSSTIKPEEPTFQVRRSLDEKTIKILNFLLNVSLLQWLYIVWSFSRGT